MCAIYQIISILKMLLFYLENGRKYSIYNNSVFPLPVYTHPGPSAGYPDPMSYMMDGQAQMMHRPPGDPTFHQGYHYPPAEYYPHHL